MPIVGATLAELLGNFNHSAGKAGGRLTQLQVDQNYTAAGDDLVTRALPRADPREALSGRALVAEAGVRSGIRVRI